MKNSFKIKFLTIIILLSSTVYAAIPENETNSFEAQYRLAKNSNLPMSTRWKALLLAAENADGEQIQKVLAFSKDKDWFMRNATLVALEKMGTDLAYDKAKEMISDKALVVRSAAADILIRLNSSNVRQIFSDELTKKYNFNGNVSLWIRPQMMKYLVQNPTSGERDFFVKYLHEKDTEMASLSVEALQKLTNIRFEGNDKLEIISKWKKYVQEKKW